MDGTNGVVDFSAVLTAKECGIFDALKDKACFEQARLDLGVVTWPGGVDFDPGWMHEQVRANKSWSVPDPSPQTSLVKQSVAEYTTVKTALAWPVKHFIRSGQTAKECDHASTTNHTRPTASRMQCHSRQAPNHTRAHGTGQLHRASQSHGDQPQA
jgi:uncharacterized membrane protein